MLSIIRWGERSRLSRFKTQDSKTERKTLGENHGRVDEFVIEEEPDYQSVVVIHKPWLHGGNC